MLLLLTTWQRNVIKASANYFKVVRQIQNVAPQLMNACNSSTRLMYERACMADVLAADRAAQLINERRERRETRNQLFHLR